MKRVFLLLLVLALAGCVTVSEHRYGHVDGSRHGSYYYDREPAVAPAFWYDPYDAVFWGLRYSYFDPFWYPGFYYGVTYFPRYYYPFGPWGGWHAHGYWSWRWYHPYSPYWGSYWDHYYAGHWHRPHERHPRRPPVGRHGAYVADGIPRFGSARNAAERAAAGMRDGFGGFRTSSGARVMTRHGWRSPSLDDGRLRSRPSSRPDVTVPRGGRSAFPPPGRSSDLPRGRLAPARGIPLRAPAARSGRSGMRLDPPPTMRWPQPANPGPGPMDRAPTRFLQPAQVRGERVRASAPIRPGREPGAGRAATLPSPQRGPEFPTPASPSRSSSADRSRR